MIDGLEKFRSHFAPFSDRYVLIGGAAASLVIEDLGGEFRTTKDLEIVLVLEALDRAFAKAFREFVRMGGYEHRQTATGRRQFYRFHKPAERDFPFMLELFSRVPDALELRTETGLTPIPVEDELASLSAILMDEAYYRFVLRQRTMIGGVPVIPAEALIPLKARAYTDLSQRRAEGQAVDSKHIKKHLRDVFRLYAVLSPQKSIEPPDAIKEHLRHAFSQMRRESIELRSLGLSSTTPEAILNELSMFFQIG